MKLHLLHGPGKVTSRNKLLELKSKFTGEVVVFEKGEDINKVMDSIATLPLLTTSRMIIWENPAEDIKLDVKKLADDLTLVLWFDHEVSQNKQLLKSVKEGDGTILLFPEQKEVSVFPFLDELGSRNKQAFLKLDKLKDDQKDTQYLITMVFYLLRSLANPPTTPPFVAQKVKKQQANFTDQELVDLYKFVIKTDFKIKKGLLDPDQAEFLIVNKFVG